MAKPGAMKPVPIDPNKPVPIRVKVRAIKDGYYDDAYRRTDSVFVLEGLPPDPKNPKHAGRDPELPAIFSTKWMEVVDERTPDRNIGSQEALKREHDEVMADRLGGVPRTPTGDQNVLG